MTAMFEINAVLVNDKLVPFAYAYTQSTASLIAQRLRDVHLYGAGSKQPEGFTVKDFTTRMIRGEIKERA